MIIDCHFHAIGSGLNNSGCWINNSLKVELQILVMGGALGLSRSQVKTNLENEMETLTESFIDGSDVDAIVLLANDLPYEKNGTSLIGAASFYVPNSYVLKRISSKILPAASINPNRKDALEELEKCFAEGAVVLKLLPNVHNFDPSDSNYNQFWRSLADKKMIYLSHTGGELALKETTPKFSNPNLLRGPLDAGVTVIGAHCGTSSLFFDKNYLDDFIKLLAEYPNLYGDNSGMLTPFRVRHFKKIINSGFADRVLYGSDLPIPISGTWPYLWRLVDRDTATKASKEKNLLQRDLILKRGIGFSKKSEITLAELLKKTPNGATWLKKYHS